MSTSKGEVEGRPHRSCRLCGYAGPNFSPSQPAPCNPCLAKIGREYRKSKPAGYWRRWHKKYALQKRYGISLDDFEKMVSAQDGKCAICGLDPSTVEISAATHRTLHVDHDHSTGRVRGLLCNGCNRAIGLLNESPAKARNLAAYLEANRG